MKNLTLTELLENLKGNHSSTACHYVVLVDKSNNSTEEASDNFEVSFAGDLTTLQELFFCFADIIITEMKKRNYDNDYIFLRFMNALSSLI